jgi:hypothetical protein
VGYFRVQLLLVVTHPSFQQQSSYFILSVARLAGPVPLTYSFKQTRSWPGGSERNKSCSGSTGFERWNRCGSKNESLTPYAEPVSPEELKTGMAENPLGPWHCETVKRGFPGGQG